MYTESPPTLTDTYLDFQSHHPIAHKIAVIKTLNHWAKNLPSTPTTTAEEERRVAQANNQSDCQNGVLPPCAQRQQGYNNRTKRYCVVGVSTEVEVNNHAHRKCNKVMHYRK